MIFYPSVVHPQIGDINEGLRSPPKLVNAAEEQTTVGRGYDAWLVESSKYLAKMKNRRKKSTLEVLRRNLDQTKRALIACDLGTNPYRITPDDCARICKYWEDLGLKPNTVYKRFNALKQLLVFCENLAAIQLEKEGDAPKRADTETKYVDFDETSLMLQASDDDTWHGWSFKAIIVLGFGAGLREGEISNALIENLDTNKWTLDIEVGKTGSRTVTIVPTFRPLMLHYINVRANRMMEHGHDFRHGPIIPVVTKKDVHRYNEASIRNIYWKYSKRSGVNANVQMLRAGHAQMCEELNVPRKWTSKQLGHSSIATTERYYLKMEPRKARYAINLAWSGIELSNGQLMAKNPTSGSLAERTRGGLDKHRRKPYEFWYLAAFILGTAFHYAVSLPFFHKPNLRVISIG